MKIYPSNHVIANVSSVDIKEEIVIGYLNNDYVNEEVELKVNSNYAINEKKEILPYTIFNSNNGFPLITMYENDSPITKEKQNSLFIRTNNDYMYMPEASITYEPYKFSYKVLTKKNIEYTSSRKFDIKIGCDSKELADKLIQYFADRREYNLYPNNISFNNGDLDSKTLYTGTLFEKSIMIIESDDGISYLNGNKIDINELIDNQVLPIIFCNYVEEKPTNLNISRESRDINTEESNILTSENNDTILTDEIMEDNYENEIEYEFVLKSPISTNINKYRSKYYFKMKAGDSQVKYSSPFLKNDNSFSPIMIKEFINRGYAIYITKNILNTISANYNLLYEMIIWAYLNGYVSTPIITEWIADEMPNFIVENNKLIQKNKFTSHMELHKLVSLYENDVIPIEVIIYPPKEEKNPIVYYTGMSSNYLIFKKIKSTKYADPIKKPNQISIYTSRKNIIYCDKFTYSIKEDITNKINYKIENENLNINIEPFKNTFLDTYTLNTPINLQYKIKNIENQLIYLEWDKLAKTIYITSTFSGKEYNTILAEINIKREKRISKLYDMRHRGGGISEEIQNYNCFDIANTLGQPYRKGGSLMCKITLPIKYEEKLEDIYEKIYATINKNMIAGDHLILNIEFI